MQQDVLPKHPNPEPLPWKDGPIEGCVIEPLTRYDDQRGWLAEFFREDTLPEGLHPAMGYLSLTRSGVARGPHEHVEQTDLFVFFDGTFRLYLWDTREDAPTFGNHRTYDLGRAEPSTAIIPPGVVHAYRNIGDTDALIINCPNRLYAGWGKAEAVDEIRHEDRDDNPFRMHA